MRGEERRGGKAEGESEKDKASLNATKPQHWWERARALALCRTLDPVLGFRVQGVLGFRVQGVLGFRV